MVYSILTDRIGNNLFQIAAGASLAHRNNTDYIACATDFEVPNGEQIEKYIKQYEHTILRKVKIINTLPTDIVTYNQPDFGYTPIEYVDNICLRGYYQTEKFFDQDFIRELFEIDEQTKAHIQKKYGHILSKGVISLHVRRGDYINRPLRQPVCCMPYFKNAISYFGKDKLYLIISDDIEWCKKNFKGNNFFFSEGESSIIDLYLQTMCKHNIISNSSFSWWGAWLNNNPEKIVIAPKNWFGKQMKDWNLMDLVPSEWVRLPNPKDLGLKLKILRYSIDDLYKRAIKRLQHIFN